MAGAWPSWTAATARRRRCSRSGVVSLGFIRHETPLPYDSVAPVRPDPVVDNLVRCGYLTSTPKCRTLFGALWAAEQDYVEQVRGKFVLFDEIVEESAELLEIKNCPRRL